MSAPPCPDVPEEDLPFITIEVRPIPSDRDGEFEGDAFAVDTRTGKRFEQEENDPQK